jgi:hypothetical protein
MVKYWKTGSATPIRPEKGADDDDDPLENARASGVFDDITPDFEGFLQNVVKLNPSLATSHHLADRIVDRQVTRYHDLLTRRIRHLQGVASGHCSSGTLCLALGGGANVIDPEVGIDEFDEAGSRATINQGSFPRGIPLPPTNVMPAELECQICFSVKQIQHPSDWTKHVYEDIRPYTCTWPECEHLSTFDRMDDWARHEREAHRRPKWWACRINGCGHICYQRSNFVQHLIHEHKIPQVSLVWEIADSCHHQTPASPENERCRFYGEISWRTWNILAEHEARHMESITFLLVRLVDKKCTIEESFNLDLPDTSGALMPVNPPLGASPPATGSESAHAAARFQ